MTVDSGLTLTSGTESPCFPVIGELSRLRGHLQFAGCDPISCGSVHAAGTPDKPVAFQSPKSAAPPGSWYRCISFENPEAVSCRARFDAAVSALSITVSPPRHRDGTIDVLASRNDHTALAEEGFQAMQPSGVCWEERAAVTIETDIFADRPGAPPGLVSDRSSLKHPLDDVGPDWP